MAVYHGITGALAINGRISNPGFRAQERCVPMRGLRSSKNRNLELHYCRSSSLLKITFPLISSSRNGLKRTIERASCHLEAKSEVVGRKPFDAPAPYKTLIGALTSSAVIRRAAPAPHGPYPTGRRAVSRQA